LRPEVVLTYMYQVTLAFKFRDRNETLTGVAECGDGKPNDSLRSGANCAGPGDAGAHSRWMAEMLS